jgi:Arc-like DNA binding domain
MVEKDKFPSETADRYIVRFPEGMRDRLKAVAEMSGRSMNSEIVQRLKGSFEQQDGLHLAIDGPLLQELEVRAYAVGIEPEELILRILQDDLSARSSDQKQIESRLSEEILRNANLADQLAALKQEVDTDFFANYNKTLQMKAFLTFMMNQWNETVPDSLMHLAVDMAAACDREIESLKDRHDEVLFSIKWKKRAQELDGEIAGSDAAIAADRTSRTHSIDNDLEAEFARARKEWDELPPDSKKHILSRQLHRLGLKIQRVSPEVQRLLRSDIEAFLKTASDAPQWDWENSEADAPPPVEKSPSEREKRQKR